MKANFKKITVEVAFDRFEELDIARQLGNFIHANTNDIGLDDVAREIYHSEGETDVSEEYARMIRALISDRKCPFLAAVKKAVINILDQE